MDKNTLTGAIESVLFAAEKPVTVNKLQEVVGEENATLQEIEECIAAIEQRYQEESCGFELRPAQGGFQFCTKKENAQWVRKFLESKPFRLSRSALETLAVIAYRQPITRAEIDTVRGIDSSHLLRTLIEKGIVKMAGKADLPGRPVQYGTTTKFLDLVGLKSVGDLPPLSELQELEGDAPKRDRLEEGMDRFVEADDILEDRQKELEEGLTEIVEIIKSAGKPTNEIHESPVHAEIAAENETAVAEFQATSRYWKKSRAAKNNSENTEEAAELETSDVQADTLEAEAEAPIENEAALEAEIPAEVEAAFLDDSASDDEEKLVN